MDPHALSVASVTYSRQGEWATISPSQPQPYHLGPHVPVDHPHRYPGVESDPPPQHCPGLGEERPALQVFRPGPAAEFPGVDPAELFSGS